MIVTAGGKNIYPEDIEGAFGEVACEELAVFAADFVCPRTGGLGDEELLAVVRDLSDTASVRSANRRLPEHKRITGIVEWPEAFPRTASLKLQRSVLAEQIRTGLSRDAIRRLS